MRVIDLIFCLLFLFVCFQGDAQETSYRMQLPEKGDVFYYKLDNLPDNILPSLEGERNVWNLSMLSAPTAHEFTFKSSSQGEYFNFFPQSTIVSIDIWKNEKYYEKYGSGLFIVGEVLKNGMSSSNVLVIKYTDPKPVFNERYAANDTQEYAAKWEVVVNASDIKDYRGDKNDLVKIEVSEEIEEEIINSGIVFLPRERYNSAFELERRISSTINFFFKRGSDEWKELGQDIALELLPVTILNFKREILVMTEERKEWLANMTLDSEGNVQNVLFKSEKEQVNNSTSYDEKSFFLYPNPSFGLVRLDFVNLPKGTYDLEVYNIIGKRIWSQSYEISGYTTIKEDLGFLSKGTYLYSVKDRSGKKLLTRKMAIINP